MRADARFDGHIVQGHVDGVGTVRSIDRRGGFDPPVGGRPGRAAPLPGREGVGGGGRGEPHGVRRWTPPGFEVVLIPHTLEVTLFGTRRPGDAVNLEADVIAKYVERLLEAGR